MVKKLYTKKENTTLQDIKKEEFSD